MAKIALVTDSTCSIPKDLVEKYEITVAPQILIWGKESLQDGVDISPNEFYNRLVKDSVMPSTSQVTVSTFHDIYQRLLAQDYQILTILVSSKLSGTVNSAVQAKSMLPAEAPIEILDSNSVAMAMGFHLLTVARAIKQGATLPECVGFSPESVGANGHLFRRGHTGVPTPRWAHRRRNPIHGDAFEFQAHP